jgi:hypothetical protein
MVNGIGVDCFECVLEVADTTPGSALSVKTRNHVSAYF